MIDLRPGGGRGVRQEHGDRRLVPLSYVPHVLSQTNDGLWLWNAG